MQKFARQIILSLQSPSQHEKPEKFPRRAGTAYMLEQKAKSKKIETHTHFLDHVKDTKLQLPITPRTLVYVVAHSIDSDPNIFNGTNTKEEAVNWNIKELAKLIAENYQQSAKNAYLAEEVDDIIKPKLTLSLVVCEAGKEGLNSKAGKLSDILYDEYQIDAYIFARTGLVGRYDGGALQKTVDGSHHEDDKKILITRDGNGKKVMYPVKYSMKNQFIFLANASGMPWHDHDDEYLATLSHKDKKFLTQVSDNINKTLPKDQVQTRVVSSHNDSTYSRIIVSKQNLSSFLNIHSELLKKPNKTDTDKDLLLFLQHRTGISHTFEIRDDIQFVSEDSYDENQLVEETEIYKKFGFSAQVVAKRDTLAQVYRICISIQATAIALKNYKLDCQKKTG